MPPPPPPPTDLPGLYAWITSSAPYIASASPPPPFPDVHDFTTPELCSALHFATAHFRKEHVELATLLAARKEAQISEELIRAVEVLNMHTPVPAPMPASGPSALGRGPGCAGFLGEGGAFEPSWAADDNGAVEMVLAAKVVGDLRFENWLGALRSGICRLRGEIGKLEERQREGAGDGAVDVSGNVTGAGDEDDWFGEGREELGGLEQVGQGELFMAVEEYFVMGPLGTGQDEQQAGWW